MCADMRNGTLCCSNMRAVALHVGSRTQKAVKAHLKKMDAGRAAAELHDQQRQEAGAGARGGRSANGPQQVPQALLTVNSAH